MERFHAPHCFLPAMPLALEVFDENPLLKERSAAVLLDMSPGLLKKWRQRNWGPNYIQYGEDGPVRYELDSESSQNPDSI